MNTEQQRAAFEAWAASIGFCVTGKYAETIGVLCAKSAFKAGYQAGRASLQSQVKKDTTLFCDLKTDEEKSAFFLSGRGYETGVIAQAIQNDVAMAYHRCAEYKKELETLQSQDREDARALHDALTRMVAMYEDEFDHEKVSQWRPDWLKSALAMRNALGGNHDNQDLRACSGEPH